MKWEESDVKKYMIGALAAGLIISTISVFLILNRDLWDQETRFLFLGMWLVFSGLIGLRPAFRKQFEFFLLSTLGGFIMCAGFPPSSLFPLVLFGFIPLFRIENSFYRGEINQRWFLYYAFNFFLIWNWGTTFWIANTAFFPGIVGMLINSGLMTLVTWWISWIHRKAGIGWYFGILFIAGWLTFEFFHLRWDLSWPWLNLGNSLASWPILAQWYEYTGALGGSLWILALNYIFFRLVQKHGLGRSLFKWRTLATWLGWLLVPVIASVVLYFSTPISGPEMSAVVINPNIEPHYEKFAQDADTKWTIYEKLLQQALESDPELIMLPETVFDRINLDNIELNPYIDRVRNLLELQNSRSRVMFGVSAFRLFSGEPVDRSSVRTSLGQDGQSFQWEVYNSAILLGNDTIPVYHKQKLVPGAEIFPYRHLLFFLNPIIDKLGGSIEGYGRIASQDVFEFGQTKLAPVICYESIYGEYMRKYIAKGANVIGVVTNDGWWGDTEGHLQHYQFAALRAIEYRRSVLRSANMGASGAFDQRGDEIVSPNDYGVSAVIPVKVTLNDTLTFYAIWGDFLGRFSVFMMVFFTLKALVNTILKSRFI